ncbi:aspartate 1-decarboxylase [Actinomyces vulturis]|uniref:aspartate 1-decarboxylase n=1 Tax=Actinomyces vulturis TaxID=1857645 RepID=UPI000B300CD9|nr:aspartate 1-decarboxylase [Actinomyces vulturis]
MSEQSSVRLRTMMTSKIHRATVTQARLDYVGSITVDQTLLEAADILPGERVDICDCTNGNRLSTYVIPGEPGSGEICINGAAAHLVQPGDIVILIAYSTLSDDVARTYDPHVVFVNEHNQIVDLGVEPGQVPSAASSQPHHQATDETTTSGSHGDDLHSSGITFTQARQA